jgi:hypothetical protein
LHSENVVARDHPRSFATIQERGTKSIRCPGIAKRTDVEMGDIEFSATDELKVVGVNGCTGIYIWADKLYAAHVSPDAATKTIKDLETDIGDNKNHITNIVICAPTDSDVTKVGKLLNGFTTVTKWPELYPFQSGNNNNEWEFSAIFTTKGHVTITKTR